MRGRVGMGLGLGALALSMHAGTREQLLPHVCQMDVRRRARWGMPACAS